MCEKVRCVYSELGRYEDARTLHNMVGIILLRNHIIKYNANTLTQLPTPLNYINTFTHTYAHPPTHTQGINRYV